MYNFIIEEEGIFTMRKFLQQVKEDFREVFGFPDYKGLGLLEEQNGKCFHSEVYLDKNIYYITVKCGCNLITAEYNRGKIFKPFKLTSCRGLNYFWSKGIAKAVYYKYVLNNNESRCEEDQGN